MKIFLLKVEYILIIPKSHISQENLTQYQGSKGHSATFDGDKMLMWPDRTKPIGVVLDALPPGANQGVTMVSM
jgi:hypothetical protein